MITEMHTTARPLIEQIDTIIFDRDGTLLKIDPQRAAALGERCVRAAPQLGPTALTDYWQRWPGPWPATAEEEPAFWQSFWAALGAATTPIDDTQRQKLVEIACNYHSMFVAYPDARPLVDRLRAAGLRLAVLTNFELPSVDATLSGAGLDPAWFAIRCASSTLVARKPDPRSFLALAAMLGVEPARCLVIDDLPEHCAGARAAGMHAIYLDRHGQGGAEGEICCASLDHVRAMLGLA